MTTFWIIFAAYFIIDALINWRLKSAAEALTPEEKLAIENLVYPKNHVYTIIALMLVVLVGAAMVNAGSPFGSPTGFYFIIPAFIVICIWTVWRKLVKIKRSGIDCPYIRQYKFGVWIKAACFVAMIAYALIVIGFQ